MSTQAYSSRNVDSRPYHDDTIIMFMKTTMFILQNGLTSIGDITYAVFILD